MISADAAEWIGDVALAACENATLCLDLFHIVRWATQALDVVRRWVWNTLRKIGLGDRAKHLKNCRYAETPDPVPSHWRTSGPIKLAGDSYALWKNPEDLTDRQAAKLAWIATHNRPL